MPEPQAKKLDVHGGELYVESRGRGAPILLVHGWTLDHRSFDPQSKALADRFRVITWDRRGFGQSGAPADLHRELDDIDRILDAFGLEDVHLLGVSQGGRIALRYAATRPGRVRSLVLQGAMIDGLPVADEGEDRIPLADYEALARAGHLDELRARWLAHPMVRLRSGGDAARQLLATIVGDYEARDLLESDASGYSFDTDPLEAMRHFNKPILLVTGAGETPARKEHARRLLEVAPLAREVLMPGSGHLANLEEPEVFNELVASFCEATDAGRDDPPASPGGLEAGR